MCYEKRQKCLREGDDVKLQHHIGGAYYVSVTSGYNCVDLRKFYQPYDSKDGQTKTTRGWCALPSFLTSGQICVSSSTPSTLPTPLWPLQYTATIATIT